MISPQVQAAGPSGLAEPHRKLAKNLVERGLGMPAILLLEVMKPFSVVAQQTLYASSPLAIMGGFQSVHRDMSSLFENRENLEEMLLEVERLMEAPKE
jgi:hypothetical protein